MAGKFIGTIQGDASMNVTTGYDSTSYRFPLGVVACRHIHGGVALNEGREAAGKLCRLNGLLHVAAGLSYGFSELFCAEQGELLLMPDQDIPPGKHILLAF